MSFGKNDDNLSRIGTYGATSQQMGNATRKQSVPRKGSPSWANNYQPSEGSPDTIRLIPGDFEAERLDKAGNIFIEKVPWFEYTDHYHGGIKKGITCSGGVYRMADRKRAQPCRGCDIWRADFEERKRIEAEKGIKPEQPKRVSFSNKYAFIALDTGWFFRGFRYDEHGRPKVNPNNNQPYTDWIKYNDQNMNIYSATAQYLGQQGKAVETQQGLIRAYPVGNQHFNMLSGYSEMAQKHCKNCGGSNCIHVQSYVCPTCQAPTFTGAELTMPADKQKEVVNGLLTCRNCQQQGYPRAITVCQHCSNPTPATLYDVELMLQTIKMPGQNAQLHLAGMSGPKPIDPVFSELLKKIPDLKAKFAPTPYAEQLALFGHPGGGAQGQQPGYGGPPQQFGMPPAPQGFQQPPAFGGYGQPVPQYSSAHVPPQQVPTQTWQQPGPATPQQPYDPSQQPGWYPRS